MKKISAFFGLVLALAACSSDPQPVLIDDTHSLPPKISLDVQAVNLADRSGAQPSGSPYSTNHFSPTISAAIKQWASDRLQAVGQTGQAIVIIKDASLTMQPLPMQTGIDSWFTRQQAVKYIGRASVSVEANGAQGFAVTDATATRFVTLPEDPTPMEKQEAYFSLLNVLMKELGQNLESGMKEHMGHFIVTAPIYGGTPIPMKMAPSGGVVTDDGVADAPISGTMGGTMPPAPPLAHPQYWSQTPTAIPLSGGMAGQ